MIEEHPANLSDSTLERLGRSSETTGQLRRSILFALLPALVAWGCAGGATSHAGDADAAAGGSSSGASGPVGSGGIASSGTGGTGQGGTGAASSGGNAGAAASSDAGDASAPACSELGKPCVAGTTCCVGTCKGSATCRLGAGDPCEVGVDWCGGSLECDPATLKCASPVCWEKNKNESMCSTNPGVPCCDPLMVCKNLGGIAGWGCCVPDGTVVPLGESVKCCSSAAEKVDGGVVCVPHP